MLRCDNIVVYTPHLFNIFAQDLFQTSINMSSASFYREKNVFFDIKYRYPLKRYGVTPMF